MRRIAVALLVLCLAGVVAACCWPDLARRTTIVVQDWGGDAESGTLDLRAPPPLSPIWFDGPLTHLERLTPRYEWEALFTDMFGRARATHVPPGLYAFTRGEGAPVNVEAIGIEVLPGRTQQVTLGRTRPTPVTVHGQVRAVVREGEEISVRGVQPRWPFIEEEFETTAAKDGTFRLEMPEVGDGEIAVDLGVPANQSGDTACIGFRTRMGGSEPLILECPVGTVEGTILDENGGPVRGTSLKLEYAQPRPEANPWPVWNLSQTDESGRFHFTHVFRGAFVLVVEGPWTEGTKAPISMRFDGSLDDDRLNLGTLRREAAGHMRVTRNIPAGEIGVQVRRAGSPLRSSFNAGWVEPGMCSAEFALQPGQYEVWSVLPGGARLVASASVSPTTLTDVSLQGAPGALLDVRADDRNGQPTAFRMSVLDGQGNVENDDRDAHFASFAHTSIDLPDGRHEVVAWDVSGRTARQSIDLRSGDHPELHLHFEP
jgi:hypothetical protein